MTATEGPTGTSPRTADAPGATAPARPRLQVALDFLMLSRAMKAAEEAMAGGADILEVGTPLLKSEGLDAVRRLKERFGDVPIVADTKTMDAGRAEMEMAAKAGAKWATVLGVSSSSTIRECVEVGRNYGISVVCPIDEQMRGMDPFDTLRAVRAAVGITVTVAGGINSETAARAGEAGADIVIVGGAITKSPDATVATRELIEALATGAARPSTEFKRFGPDQLREAFSKVSTSNLSDALHRGGVIDGIHSIVPGKHMVGRAVTVRTYPGDWAKPVEAIDLAEPGDVLVIDAGGRPPAVWGELATESCIQRKLAGVVIDGAIRDVDAIRSLGFPSFCRCTSPHAWEPKGFGEIGTPIMMSNVRIASGDWIVGDDSGVVHVPADRAVEAANRALDVLEMENRVRGEIHAGNTLGQVIELYRWEKA
ncbi:MAG: orotidine 5'-phosphate decarboxylase / HUMPS family protein [Planctomycetota bacterium]|jgi:3-hexulose-6-phosphate synthase/6-phospho-3-hexuloisomerase